MNDTKLVNLLKNNPSKGLEAAVQKYSGLVKTIVLRIIGYDNQRDVEELFQMYLLNFGSQ